MNLQKRCWPAGKTFAFTIFDDTDFATVDNVKDVYKFLADHGFRTTKSVWPGGAGAEKTEYGSTCKDPVYFAWVRALQMQGFEIGYHLTNSSSSAHCAFKSVWASGRVVALNDTVSPGSSCAARCRSAEITTAMMG